MHQRSIHYNPSLVSLWPECFLALSNAIQILYIVRTWGCIELPFTEAVFSLFVWYTFYIKHIISSTHSSKRETGGKVHCEKQTTFWDSEYWRKFHWVGVGFGVYEYGLRNEQDIYLIWFNVYTKNQWVNLPIVTINPLALCMQLYLSRTINCTCL